MTEHATLTCDWCGALGDDIGPAYGSLRVAKCSGCHHEWQYVEHATPSADPVPVDRLRARINASGLSHKDYARKILLREDRTLRRWLRGGPIPKVVQEEHLHIGGDK